MGVPKMGVPPLIIHINIGFSWLFHGNPPFLVPPLIRLMGDGIMS